MTEELKQELSDDIELAKTMTTITSPEAVLELTNKLIYYLDMINTSITDLDYRSALLKGKQKILLEYVRTSKQLATNLSIQRQNETRKY